MKERLKGKKVPWSHRAGSSRMQQSRSGSGRPTAVEKLPLGLQKDTGGTVQGEVRRSN